MNAMTFTPAPAEAPAAPAPSTLAPTAGSGGQVARWLRGPDDDPTWARPALLGLLLATAAFYLYNLTASGYANSFYSAAAQAGSASWKAFFYGSLDSANAITVDKPPAALWAMALSVRVFGLSSFAILLPEVLMGVATVGIVYAAVKRYFGAAAGLIAGAVLALTPVAVLMFRFNNPDAMLVMLMALGAYATLRSIERGSARWMALAGVFIGLGFLTKTLQVLLVVPFFGIAYLVAADTTLRRRITGAVVGVAAMVLSAGWWVAIVELVPASMRPYVGGSQTNSFLELTFGYNGFGRISGDEAGSIGPNSGTGSITRMFSSAIGGQISWLIPSALVLLAVGLYLRGRRPRTDPRRAAYLVWGGWLLVTGLTFSLMEGIFHEYYTVALAPAVAALVGMGAVEAWEHRNRAVGSVTLAAATAAAATWSFILLSRTTAYGDWLRVGVLAVGMAAALLLLAVSRVDRRAIPVIVGAALVAALAGPAAYAATTVSTGHSGSIVTAGPSTGGFGGGGRPPGGFGGPVGPTQPGRPGATNQVGPNQVGQPGAPNPGRAEPAGRRWSPQRDEPEHRGRRGPVGERRPVHLGRRRRRLPERRRAPARRPAPGHGDRRLQRLRPVPDPGPVRAGRRRRQDPLLPLRRRVRPPERRVERRRRDRQLGLGELHPGDDRHLHVLRPHPAAVGRVLDDGRLTGARRKGPQP